jgi:anaerobic selenocysteine-containing dehydrogenase
MDSKKVKELINPEISRRKFIKVGTTLSATATVAGVFMKAEKARAFTPGENEPDRVETESGVKTVFTVCQNCHSRCGLMCKVVDGVLVKIDGNPYHPNNMEEDERLPYSTDPAEAAKVRGRVCPKGQAGIQVLYDPYRIKHPLKRVGARGSGKWEVITWEQAFTEIAQKINELIPTARRMIDDIDPDISALGKIANGLMFSPGRSTDGEIIERIFRYTYGTANYRLDHTSICEQSHHVGNEAITEDKGIWGGSLSGKNHFKPDIMNSEFLLLFGQNPLEANFPLVALGRKIVEFKRNGGKIALVDPRFNTTATKADWWVPIKPGTDAAFALGMARWIIENNKYDATYLVNANSAAASADKEKTWSDATYLVMLRADDDPDYPQKPGSFLQSGYVNGMAATTNKVVWDGSNPVEVGTSVVEGVLETGEVTLTPSGTVPAGYVWTDGLLHCKSVFQLLKERVMEKTLSEYAAICGIDVSLIIEIANEFTKHGKKAVANTYRGVVQHTNGVHSQIAIMALNHLIGNYSWMGGNSSGGGGWSNNGVITDGSVPKDVKSDNIPSGKQTPSGPRIDRANGANYELFKGYAKMTKQGIDNTYPAKRPWFKFGTHGNYQEVIPSIADQYPYPCKVLITYWNAWPYSTPALRNIFEATIRDESKVPLFISINKDMGEVSAFADYILPDTSYLEKWSFPGMTPTIQTKATSFRQPVVGTFDGRAWDAPFDKSATNDYTPILPDTKLFEDILIGLMKALGLDPGVRNGWEIAKWMLYHLAQDYKTKTGSTKSLDELVDEIIAKGGVFEDPMPNNEYVDSDGRLKYSYSGVVHFYIEPIANYVDSITGKMEHDPLPVYEPIKDVSGNIVEEPAYPFKLITFKRILHGQARTHQLPWLMGIEPENFIELNSSDARVLGVETGDPVRVSSVSNPTGIVGKAKVVEGLRPGVVAISHHYGHWQNGSNAWYENGSPVDYDPSRGRGVAPNQVMRLDPVLGNVPLQDKIGASCAFYDTWVKVEKA